MVVEKVGGRGCEMGLRLIANLHNFSNRFFWLNSSRSGEKRLNDFDETGNEFLT